MYHHRRPQQAGFMPGRSTTDQISSVRLLVEKAHEYRRGRDLCIAFIDPKSAFDSVDRDAIWLVLRSVSVPEKIIRLLQLLHSNSQSCVRFNGEDTPWFQTTSGVRQGCTAAPDLFNCLIDYLMQKVNDRTRGVNLRNYRITDLEFADDTALFAPDLGTLTEVLEIYVNEATKLGLNINYAKTKIMIASESTPPQSIENQSESNMRIYNACVLSVLLYGSETWPLSASLARRLAGFETRAQRRVLGIRRQDRVTIEELRRRSLQPPLPRLLAQRRLRWFGHVLRMPCLLYTSPSPRDLSTSRMPSSA